jgi:hypothetical protein
MLVSGRKAITILSPAVSGRAQATQVLRSGLAGPPTPTPRGPMYDERHVTALLRRPVVEESSLRELCPHGLYVARMPRTCEIPVGAGWAELATALGRRPRMPALSVAVVAVRMTAWGGLPWIATVCGWVVLSAEACGFRVGSDGDQSFELRPPGSWAVAFDGHRLPTPRGGRPWYLWTPRPD